jgi:hypothetical protein
MKMAARKVKKDDMPNDRLNAILDKYKGDCETRTTYITLDLSSDGQTFRSMISDYTRGRSRIPGSRPRVFAAVGIPSLIVRVPPRPHS